MFSYSILYRMNPGQAVILGLVEGITEFLPVSSTAHIIITAKILGIAQTTSTGFFEIFIQAGAILAALLLFYKMIFTHKHLVEQIIYSFVPTALLGIFAHKYIKTFFFQSMPAIGFSLIIASIIFIIVEGGIRNNKIKLDKTIKELTHQDALIIGAAQAIALFPGVSRAGAVIVTMLILGYNRKEATIYSFILAIPTIFAAALFDLVKTKDVLSTTDLIPVTIGFITAFLSAYFVIKLFIKFTQDHTLMSFALYRFIIAIPLLT